jgi:hypothetical protein
MHIVRVNPQDDNDSPANEAETRKALLERTGRDFTPILKDFVQKPRGNGESRQGPLAEFIRGRDPRALQAFLLIISVNSSGEGKHGWSTTLPIKVWARAFGTTQNATLASAATAASKVLTRLSNRNLITREKAGQSRQVRVTLLREDGSGQPYTRPASGNNDRFLKLPHAYWTDGWNDKLDLPATAMLLLALHEKPGFELPTEKMSEWYGWSADTAERGFRTLYDHGILDVHTRMKKAPLSPTGLSKVNLYRLRPPFAETQQPKPPTLEELLSVSEDHPKP